MRRRVVVIGLLCVLIFAFCAVAVAQPPSPPSGQERLRDVGERGTMYLSLILSLFLVLLLPTAILWILCRIMRMEEVGVLRALYCAIVGFVAALILFYGVKPLTGALKDYTLFYKNMEELGWRAGIVIIISFIVLMFFMRTFLIRAIIFTVFYIVSLYVAAWLAYSFIESTGATELLKTG
jgi:hypothetical protein